MFKKLNVEIDSSYTEDCHWLRRKKPKRVILNFTNGKTKKRIWKAKKNLNGMNLSGFISESLCKY